jgi:putative membrane protein
MSDFVLASGHHLAAFLLFAALFAEMVTLRPGGATDGKRLSMLDAIYGLSALAVLGFGISRLLFAAKGWEFYQHNAFFWTKMALFAAVGLLSIPPTLAFRKWRKLGGPPDDSEVTRVRRYLHAQLLLFLFIPVAAAAMARGYGQY